MAEYSGILMVTGLIVAVLGSFAALLFLMLRGGTRYRFTPPAHSQTDLTNMMILFQTMRDILAQQKDLAREFNISIDRKVNEVRDLLQSTGDVREQLERAKEDIAALSSKTRTELNELQNRLSEVGGADLGTSADSEDVADPEDLSISGGSQALEEDIVVEPLYTEVEAVVDEDFDERPIDIVPLRPLAPNTDLIDRWTGADFGDDEVEELEEVEDDAEEEAEEAEQTRDAFRSLLNFETDLSGNSDGFGAVDTIAPEDSNRQYLTPIQKRIYEYSDAGMRVPEIAKSLGVGKGEVRLVLSLRQNRSA